MSKIEVFGSCRSILTLFVFLSSVNLTAAQQCTTQTPDFYDGEQFVVSDVKITSKERVFNLVQNVSTLLSAIPLQPGKRFSKEDLAASKRSLIDGLIYIEVPGSIYVPLVDAIFDKCNKSTSPKQAEVTFSVSYFVRSIETSADYPVTYEQPEKKTVRLTARTSRLKRLLNFLRPQSYVGYTGSNNLVGAGITVDAKNSLFQNFSMEGAGSTSSALGSASVQGKRTFGSSALQLLVWRSGYEYSKMPAEHDIALKKGTGYAQFFATTRSFDNEDENQELIIRYGASVEGGLRQTNAEGFLIPTGDLPSSNYESIKTYIGGSWRLGRHLFKTSYGLQIARTNHGHTSDRSVDFLKHIWDSSYKVRFFPWDNKPVFLEAQFTTGTINQRGALPVAERFFGGNIEENLIAGADWLIRSGPFIRSFPGQRLTTNASFLGGNSFASTNLTLAVTVWAKPAIPKEAQEQIPIAFEILETHPKGETLRRLLTTAFTTETQSYAEQIASFDYKVLENELLDLQRDLASIPAGDVTPATKKLIEKCSADLKSALEVLALIKEKIVFDPDGKFVTTNLDARPEIVELVIASLPEDPDDPDAPPEAGLLRKIVEELGELVKQTDTALGTLRPRLSERQANVQTFADSLKNRYDTFQKEGLPEARANAIKFIQDTHSQIDIIARQLNRFSIGPLFMFDAARVRVQGANGSFRYGVGPGLDIGLFGFEFRSGYSFNPNRRPGEPRGAVVFSFDVADILP